MKILFINKYDIRGGAAIAAWRLQEALHQQYHTDNRLLAGIKAGGEDKQVKATRKKGIENFLERGINYGLNRIGIQYFWFPFSTKRILHYARAFQPDVISLHNLHGGYFKTSLLEPLSSIAPLIWTLHDMWAFTANGAYTFGDDSWKQMKSGAGERNQFPTIGLNTGNLLLKRKKHIYENSNLTLVCPSRWMQNQAEQSPVFSGKRISHIPNGIPLNRFCPSTDRNKVRQSMGLHAGQQVLLLFSERLKDPRKGGNDLLDVLKKLDRPKHKRVTLLLIGKGKLPLSFVHLKHKSLGYLSKEKEIIAALQASDLFIFPTREDNLPNTLIEAIACGLPCVTYDVGGCGEIIINGQNGLLVSPGDKDALQRAIMHMISNPNQLRDMQIRARERAETHFDVQLMAKRYYTLFKELSKKE